MDLPLYSLPPDTLRQVRTLTRNAPWRVKERDDRGLRARYARWNPSVSPVPGPSLLGPLWRFIPSSESEEQATATSRGVEWAGIVLHLIAVGPEIASGKPTLSNLGQALRRADMKENRFVRLMHAPLHTRLESLSRALRLLKRSNVPYSPILTQKSATDEKVTFLHPIKDSRSDDLAALLTFLFVSDASASIARWSQGYFQPTEAETTDVSK